MNRPRQAKRLVEAGGEAVGLCRMEPVVIPKVPVIGRRRATIDEEEIVKQIDGAIREGHVVIDLVICREVVLLDTDPIVRRRVIREIVAL